MGNRAYPPRDLRTDRAPRSGPNSSPIWEGAAVGPGGSRRIGLVGQWCRRHDGEAGWADGAVPLLRAVVPVYWLGPIAETVAASWPGHVLGLTPRAPVTAHGDEEWSMLLARTNPARGVGASLSPLVAPALVRTTGTVPPLVAAILVRRGATALIGGIGRAPALPQDPTEARCRD